MTVNDDLFVLCREASKGLSNEELNLSALFDGVGVQSFPETVGPMTLVGRIEVVGKEKDEAAVKLAIRLKTPSGKYVKLNNLKQEITLGLEDVDEQRAGFVILIRGVEVAEEGKYIFELRHNNQTVDRTSFMVEKVVDK